MWGTLFRLDNQKMNKAELSFLNEKRIIENHVKMMSHVRFGKQNLVNAQIPSQL